MKNKTFKVSFDDKGNLYPQIWQWMINNPNYIVKEEDNYVFKDILKYSGYFTPRGGHTHLEFVSTLSGRKYFIFMKDFDLILKSDKYINGCIEGEFTFVKRGCSQGIKIIF